MTQETNISTESATCNFVGWAIVVLGIIAGFIIIVAFGRVEIPVTIAGDFYGTKKEWSGAMIMTGIAVMLNGFIVGYLFQKIASILRYHENKSIEKAP
ncbi:hypothetical protein [Acinetobacter guillouiae]|uniref:hypothetical protein n=1 Tax=Acinetobacter guillouiae TaxID=106649 RepID=UPI001CD4F654|nr:hypothetical protein [Acinetobacter guillouiae]